MFYVLYQEKFSIEGGESKHKTNNKYYFMLNSDVLDHDELFELFELILQKNIEVIKKKQLLHEKNGICSKKFIV